MARLVLLTLCVLWTLETVTPFDLHTLLSQGTSGISSMVSPEMLRKIKGIIPGSSSPADIHEIERIISQLRPAEGRFDPAVLEVLANMDASRRAPSGSSSSTPRSHRHAKSTSSIPPLEVLNFPDEMPSTTSQSLSTDAKPKFSSKFRLQEQKEAPVDTTSAMVLDHVSDPNLRNHRLYEADKEEEVEEQEVTGHRERYENYENFTTIDQLEDLMADETSPQQVVAAMPKGQRSKLSPGKKRGKFGPHGKRKNHHHPGHSHNDDTPATTSLDELISLETTEENESTAHEREALKRASTERTVVYSNSMTAPSSERPYHDDHDETTMAFRPSPVDMSAPMYTYGQEHQHHPHDYYISKSKPKLKLKRPRRPQLEQQQLLRRHSSSSPRPVYNHKFDETYHYDEDYEKEQPDYQNVVNYLKLQGQGQTIRTSTPYAHTGHDGYSQHHMTPQPIPPPPPPPQPDPSYMNVLNPHMKHNRILTPADAVPIMHSPVPSPTGTGVIQPNGLIYPEHYNRYVPAASDNVYNDVHHSNNYNHQYYPQQHQVQDLAYSAGQNYYQGNGHGHGQGHGHQPQEQYHGHEQHQGYSSNTNSHHHYPHHVEDNSSWSSTFLILGGLIVLSAAIAFLLPSFVTGSPVSAGGKDTGMDKNSNSDNDLWTEIKALYNDIVNLARGDYSHFHKYNREQDLPKINIVDDEEDPQKIKSDHDNNSSTLNKRLGEPGDETASSSEEQDNQFTPSHPQQEHHQVDGEDSSTESDQQQQKQRQQRKQRPKRKRVVDKDSLAYAIYGKGGVVSTSNNKFNFANAFNQTLNAWEKVPLIAN